MEQYKTILSKYLPAPSVDIVFSWIQTYKVHLRISKARNTKLGDFRQAYNGKPHRISINYNLNQYAFLITFVHELAHLVVAEKYGRRAKPHGKEWKAMFKDLMEPIFDLAFFPQDINSALRLYLKNAGASSTSNLTLARVLRSYDKQKEEGVAIEELPEGQIFYISSGKLFTKGEKRRKRYKCQNLQTGKYYLFDPLAIVYPSEDKK